MILRKAKDFNYLDSLSRKSVLSPQPKWAGLVLRAVSARRVTPFDGIMAELETVHVSTLNLFPSNALLPPSTHFQSSVSIIDHWPPPLAPYKTSKTRHYPTANKPGHWPLRPPPSYILPHPPLTASPLSGTTPAGSRIRPPSHQTSSVFRDSSHTPTGDTKPSTHRSALSPC